jgi:hypothetical protein
MTTHITKTWIEDGKLITELFKEEDIYKRTWVGLTDDERLDVVGIDCADDWFWEVCKTIETKLKEKNT